MAAEPVASHFPFMLLFRNGGAEAHAHLAPAERAALMHAWNAWIEGLTARGVLEQGRPLGLTGKVVSEPRGAKVTDGPYAEAKEVVAGYVMIRAVDLAAAAEIAKGCPGLAIGLTVEVRPLLDFSPVLQEVRAVPGVAAR